MIAEARSFRGGGWRLSADWYFRALCHRSCCVGEFGLNSSEWKDEISAPFKDAPLKPARSGKRYPVLAPEIRGAG